MSIGKVVPCSLRSFRASDMALLCLLDIFIAMLPFQHLLERMSGFGRHLLSFFVDLDGDDLA